MCFLFCRWPFCWLPVTVGKSAYSVFVRLVRRMRFRRRIARPTASGPDETGPVPVPASCSPVALGLRPVPPVRGRALRRCFRRASGSFCRADARRGVPSESHTRSAVSRRVVCPPGCEVVSRRSGNIKKKKAMPETVHGLMEKGNAGAGMGLSGLRRTCVMSVCVVRERESYGR